VLLVTVACAATGLVAAKTRPPSYQATAELVVNPVSLYDTTFLGLPVIRDTGDPTQTLQTAAIVVQTSGAARRLAARLPGWTPDRVASAVTVEPEGNSNVLGVTASADSPALAARIANGYARAALDQRTSQLRTAIDRLVRQLRAQENLVPNGERSGDLAARVTQLEAARTGGDPGISGLQPAVVPRTPTGVSAKVVLVLSIIAGFVLGCAVALLLRRLSTKVRDEEEAVRLYPMPVLAHVPRVSARSERNLIISPRIRDAFRGVFLELATGGSSGRSLMITGASRDEGKTISAVSLATTIAETGRNVILVDNDPESRILQTLGFLGTRLDTNGRALSTTNGSGRPGTGLDEMVVQVPSIPNLSVISVVSDSGHDALLDNAARHDVRVLLRRAITRGDWVVINTAPIGEVSDALWLATEVTDVLWVVRLQHTDRRLLVSAREQLERVGVRPHGMLILDDRGPSHGDRRFAGLRQRAEQVPAGAGGAAA
jgi:Mrp family chromosome partitioning ATPase